MTPLEQRIAIGNLRGWKTYPDEKPSHHGHLLAVDPAGDSGFMPDYLKDRNAMAEALSTLDDETGEWDAYTDELGNISGAVSTNDWGITYTDWRILLNPSLEHQAESFLKAKGLWEECSE